MNYTYIYSCAHTYFLNENMHCMYISVSCFPVNFSAHSSSFPFDNIPCFRLSVLCFLACSGEMHELHADGDPDVEAPRQLQGTRAVLLFGRTQVLHPLEAVTQE